MLIVYESLYTKTKITFTHEQSLIDGFFDDRVASLAYYNFKQSIFFCYYYSCYLCLLKDKQMIKL